MPFSLLHGTTEEKTLELFEEIRESEALVDSLRQEFTVSLWHPLRSAVRLKQGPGTGQSAFRRLLRVHRRVVAGEPLGEREEGSLASAAELAGTTAAVSPWERSWAGALARNAEVRARAERVLAESVRSARQAVAARFRSPRLQHAVFVSNPRFFHSALDADSPGLDLPDQGEPSRALRRRLATAHRYLRRFASRCETVSFFGPALHARLDENSAEALGVGDPGPERVAVEASSWLVRALQDRATEQAAPEELRVWRRPLLRSTDRERTLRFAPDGRLIRLPPELWEMWEEADGRTVGALAAALGTTVPEVGVRLRRMRALVETAVHRVPSVELFPLAALADHAGSGTGAEDFARLIDGYARAPWPERRTWAARIRALAESHELETERHRGEHYADRELYYEDRASPFSERVRLGRPAVEGIGDALRSVLPLAYLGALLAREDARDAVRARLAEGASRSLTALAGSDLGPGGSRLSDLRAALAGIVGSLAAAGAQVVRLTSAQVEEVTAPFWDTVPEEDRWDPCLPSPDLMVTGLAEPGTWVLSELHDDCGSMYGGLERRLHSDPDGLWADFTEEVASFVGPRAMATIVSRRRSAHVTPEPPGLSLELSGTSEKDPELVRPVGEADITADARRVEVDGRLFQLYPGDLSSALHRAVSLPSAVPVDIDTGDFTPRVVVDGVVHQRARWRLELPDRTTDHFERWLALQRLRAENGLPRHVFARHPDETKPVHVDFADPLSVDDLGRLPTGRVTFTEMLPGPDGLWWDSPGEAQCVELRLGCLVRALPAEDGKELQ
ncbi:hypothetical protein ACFV4I_21110 [Nocardiopsis alba]|uniref:hypothetical protein n=1 Tax=Nocardiopsis alba TaxID=53437 RepID=UPI0036522ABA